MNALDQNGPISVTAVAVGHYGKHRMPGDKFTISSPAAFSSKWMTSADTRVNATSFKGVSPEQIDRQLAKVEAEIADLEDAINRLSYASLSGHAGARNDLDSAESALKSKLADKAALERAISGANSAVKEQRAAELEADRAKHSAAARAAATELAAVAEEADAAINNMSFLLRKLETLETTVRRSAVRADYSVDGKTGQSGLPAIAIEAMSRALSKGPISDSRSVAQTVAIAWAHLFDGAE